MAYGKEVAQECLDIKRRCNKKEEDKDEQINLDETFDYCKFG